MDSVVVSQNMKKKIHPRYFEKSQVTCSCGNSFEVGSTEEKIVIEVCSACHPFYTGKQKLVDVAGRIDKFKKRMKGAAKAEKAKKAIVKNKGKEPSNKKEDVVKLG